MNKEKFKILIVEDDLLIAKSLKIELEVLSYEVATAKNGLKAIDYIVEKDSECDLILMDINLGHGIDGFETATEINKHKEIPVVFLSSNLDIKSVDDVQGTNAYGYVLKQSGISILDFNIQLALRRFHEKKKSEEILKQTNCVSNIYELYVGIATLYLKNSDFIIDEKINESLRQIGVFTDADRVYIFDYDFKNGLTSNTYEWCKKGIDPEIMNLQNIPLDYIPDWRDAHASGLPLIVESVDALENDDPIKAILAPQNIKSLITIPILSGDICTGFVGLDYVSDYKKMTFRENLVLTNFSQILQGLRDRRAYESLLNKQLIEKNSVLKEINHRIANNNTIICSLLGLQIKSTNNIEVKTELQNVLTRILSINNLYTNLIYSNDHLYVSLDVYFEGLIANFKSAFEINAKFDINLSVEKIEILSSTVVTIGIIINELLTNIYKYAFVQRTNGIAEIIITKKEESLVLLVKDNGIGIDKEKLDEEKFGFGLSTIKMLAEEQLDGTFNIYRQNGTTIEITFIID
jgi:two-component sensor histidine kinase/FixJ family two-component response regulator